MDKITLYNNTVEGLTGGASSIIPVWAVSLAYLGIGKIVNGSRKTNVAAPAFAIFSIAFGVASAIVGGALADNSTDSVYNGIKYGCIVANLVSMSGILIMRYTDE